MKHRERTLISTLAGLALCTPGNAVIGDATGNLYQGIVDRNVFGLKPPPPPPDPESTEPPPPKVFLTGITTILGSKRALLKMTPPAKPGEPAREQSFTLREGQRDGDIEVLEINEKVGAVKIKGSRHDHNPRFRQGWRQGDCRGRSRARGCACSSGRVFTRADGECIHARGRSQSVVPRAADPDSCGSKATIREHGRSDCHLIPPVPTDLAPPAAAANDSGTATRTTWTLPRAPSLPLVPQ